jgi:putative phosphoribosyl transferase
MVDVTTRPIFRDRDHAGRVLGLSVDALANRRDVIVLALPRGGVPVARQVAHVIGAPLDVIVARKLGVPGIGEVALGAIAEGRDRVVEDAVGWYVGVPRRVVARIANRERAELVRQRRVFRSGCPLPDLRRRTVVLVDDGIATGATLRAAALAVRRCRPVRLIAAVPVASAASCADMRGVVDDLIVTATPEPFGTVSACYEDFSPVQDMDVLRLLGREPRVAGTDNACAPDGDVEREVSIPIADAGDGIAGDLGLPNDDPLAVRGGRGAVPRGLVILVHGGGSTRHSYRNRYLAARLRMEGWTTLRLDLLLGYEQTLDVDGVLRFDVGFLARRVVAASEWAASQNGWPVGPVILFGASTGAAAALVAAAERPELIAGVVTRGGRVDRAAAALPRVRAPVLMIAGSMDAETVRSNREALSVLGGDARLTVVRGAGHTFEEPGALGEVAERAVAWLERASTPHSNPTLGRWLSVRRA